MIRARLRRRSGGPEPVIDEGPFVSFTDLFIGILFLFLILVAALMLRQQAAVQAPPSPPPPVKPEPVKPVPERKPDQPAFRLGIVFNIYQRAAEFDGGGWTYSRTVRVFRSVDGRCINTVWMRSNLTTSWKPPTASEDIPTGAQAEQLGTFEPCGLSASGDHWETSSETGDLKRIGPNLYSGYAVLHKKEGDEKLEIQYRVLGVYDDHFRSRPMKPGLALLACGGALALAFAAAAQTLSLQGPGDGPKAPAVDPATVQGLPSARDYHPPEGIAFKATDFLSENVRLTAQWFYAAGNDGRTLPTVIMAHGWGATAASLRDDAVALARAGYLVMLFDYRGWGDSDGRVLLTGRPPVADGTFTAEVRQVRGYVDPWEQSEDWFNAVSYAVASPMVDAGRIGLRGSDLSGGYVLYAAAHDPRIKAVVSQVTWADLRPSKPYQSDPARVIAEADAAATGIATGQGSYPADRARVGGLVGASVGNKLARWTPVDEADGVTQPALFVLAEKEELFSNVFNGQMACERVQGPRKMVILPKITHYDIYGLERDRAITAAIDWFDKYLKPPGAPTRAPINRKEPERGPCNPPPAPPTGEEPKDGSGQGHKAPNTPTRFN